VYYGSLWGKLGNYEELITSGEVFTRFLCNPGLDLRGAWTNALYSGLIFKKGYWFSRNFKCTAKVRAIRLVLLEPSTSSLDFSHFRRNHCVVAFQFSGLRISIVPCILIFLIWVAWARSHEFKIIPHDCFSYLKTDTRQLYQYFGFTCLDG